MEWGLLSLFSLEGEVEGITLRGVQYPLEDGRLTQQGTHEQLCREEGLYKRINSIQNALEEELTLAKAEEVTQ